MHQHVQIIASQMRIDRHVSRNFLSPIFAVADNMEHNSLITYLFFCSDRWTVGIIPNEAFTSHERVVLETEPNTSNNVIEKN